MSEMDDLLDFDQSPTVSAECGLDGRSRCDGCWQLDHSTGLGKRGSRADQGRHRHRPYWRDRLCRQCERQRGEDAGQGSQRQGGLLGRPLELYIEDTASNESVAVPNVRKLIQRDKVDVVLGGITSSMRNAIKDTIVKRGKTLYIYPQLYEGQECEDRYLLHRPDAGPAVRHLHSLAHQERWQAVRLALGQLRVAASAQRVRP